MKYPWPQSRRVSNHPLYNRFAGMKARCNIPTNKNYKHYGGRGIKVEWISFEQFKNDMYKSFLAHVKKHGGGHYTSIERIDNNGHYCKENCRWATPTEQLLNQRDIRHRKNGRFAEKPE